MALIDHEKAWLRLKAHVVTKRSHGERELLETMGRIEVECMVPEGQEGFDSSPPFRRSEEPRVARGA